MIAINGDHEAQALPARQPSLSMNAFARTLSCLAVTSALCGCAAMPPQYMLIPASDVTLRCQDGFMTYNNSKARRILVTPYLASQAQYAICAGSARLPVRERARQAAQKKLGTSCRIDAMAEPLPLNYEFAYTCGVVPATASAAVAATAAPAATPVAAPAAVPLAPAAVAEPPPPAASAPPVLRPSQ